MPMNVRFLENRPVLRDRLCALAVFTGIAIGGVSGLEMVIGGGFDVITPSLAYEAPSPRAWYDNAFGSAWAEPYANTSMVTPISQPFALDSFYGGDGRDLAYVEELDGGPDASPPPRYRQTHALYDDDGALVSAADGPLDDATLDRIVQANSIADGPAPEAADNAAGDYAAQIDDLYAEQHAAAIVARETTAPTDAKLSGSASPL